MVSVKHNTEILLSPLLKYVRHVCRRSNAVVSWYNLQQIEKNLHVLTTMCHGRPVCWKTQCVMAHACLSRVCMQTAGTYQQQESIASHCIAHRCIDLYTAQHSRVQQSRACWYTRCFGCACMLSCENWHWCCAHICDSPAARHKAVHAGE